MCSQSVKQIKINDMETTDFAKHLSAYFLKYLPGERGASHHTILSYRDTFVLFIDCMKTQKGIPAEKLWLANITKALIVEFLNRLQEHRGSSNATRNYRLAAIHSFFACLQYEIPEKISQWQEILSIKVKRTHKKSINYRKRLQLTITNNFSTPPSDNGSRWRVVKK